MKLLLATSNRGKLGELQKLLCPAPFELTSPLREGILLSVEEAGETLEENAAIKALAFHKVSGLLTLADDSGIFVDALGGKPGVHSARFAGPDATDADRVALLLKLLDGVPLFERGATFRCVIAIAGAGENILYAYGECSGIISLKSSGENGFGYDPIFLLADRDLTMAELSPDKKDTVSHRGKAARAALQLLEKLRREHDEALRDLRQM